jgi:hypothetical protein
MFDAQREAEDRRCAMENTNAQADLQPMSAESVVAAPFETALPREHFAPVRKA